MFLDWLFVVVAVVAAFPGLTQKCVCVWSNDLSIVHTTPHLSLFLLCSRERRSAAIITRGHHRQSPPKTFVERKGLLLLHLSSSRKRPSTQWLCTCFCPCLLTRRRKREPSFFNTQHTAEILLSLPCYICHRVLGAAEVFLRPPRPRKQAFLPV